MLRIKIDNMSTTQLNKDQIKTSPRRLRNHSKAEIATAGSLDSQSAKMAGKLPEVSEEDGDVFHGTILISKEEFAKKTTNLKLDAVAEAINKIYMKMSEDSQKVDEKLKPMREALFDENAGILPQMEAIVDHVKGVDDRIQILTEENLQLRDELDILKGVVHKIANQVQNADGKISQLVVKSMEDNLVISGILDDVPKRNARKQIHAFFREELDLRNINDNDVLKVYRMGKYEAGKSRNMMVQCTTDLRRYIMRNAPRLRDRLNQQGGRFFINQQLPESVAESNREIREIIKVRRAKEEDLPQQARSSFLVRNNKVFINGQLNRKKIVPPSVEQLFPSDDLQKKINSSKLRTFRAKPEAGSIFRVSVFSPESMDQVRLAYVKLFQNNPSADHIAVACVVNGEEAHNDNGEFGSSIRLLRCIRDEAMDNVALFMTRQFGGVHLGPKRFNIMTNLAGLALEKLAEMRVRKSVSGLPSSPSPVPDMAANDEIPPSSEGRPTDSSIEEPEKADIPLHTPKINPSPHNYQEAELTSGNEEEDNDGK